MGEAQKSNEVKYSVLESEDKSFSEPNNVLKIPKAELDKLKTKYSNLESTTLDGTKEELLKLQELVNQNNYTALEEALRSELIEAQVDIGDVKLDILSTGAKGTIPEAVLNKVGSYIDTKLKYDFLDKQHKENIKIATVGRILSSGKGDELLNTFNDITKKGNGIENIETKFNTIIDTEMKDIIDLLNNAKDEDQKKLIKEGLLSNPEEIQLYKEKGKINDIKELKGPELVTYLSGINNHVINLEKKGGNIKENLMATLSKMPSWLSEVILGFLSKILGFFLGEAQAEKWVLGFKKEIQNRKSVDNLLLYGNTINEKGEPIPGAKKGTIKLFEDKNINGLESKKLSKFFDNCREKGIDITEDNFWEKVFNSDGKIVVDKEGKEIKEKVPHTYIFDKDKAKIEGDANSPDFTDFYKALNDPGFIIDKTVPSTPPPEEKTKEQAQQEEQANKEKMEKQIENLDKVQKLISGDSKDFQELKTINISDIFNRKDEVSLLLTFLIQDFQTSRGTTWSNNVPLEKFLNNYLNPFENFLNKKKDALVKKKESKTQ